MRRSLSVDGSCAQVPDAYRNHPEETVSDGFQLEGMTSSSREIHSPRSAVTLDNVHHDESTLAAVWDDASLSLTWEVVDETLLFPFH
ncbi:hypothetical protein PROFUN_06971 [Planoprotostelium fungivorum]|uniref:Uncharacterized protein n=1 Tax=Planoprotostelium fungivorum TaxID=1890364 RepID=A0A2P6NN97_9EUKA|nr:hypothetical protein PROFUN_06971 [Planoprotostelium fungivorum]